MNGLYKQLNVRHVVIGDGFVFGAGQSGNVATLQQAGAKLGFEVHALPVVRVEGIVASSTKIREFIAEGNIPGARLLLGRPPELAGRISHGDGRGKEIGFGHLKRCLSLADAIREKKLKESKLSSLLHSISNLHKYSEEFTDLGVNVEDIHQNIFNYKMSHHYDLIQNN